jgi:hypothetical protein
MTGDLAEGIRIHLRAALLPCLCVLFINGGGMGAQTNAMLSGQGGLDSARLRAQKEYDVHPSDPEFQMAFARLMRNGDSARMVYKKVIAQEKAPDSLKAEAYYRLACISYMAANYIKAENYCAAACSLDKKDVYERLCGRSTTLAGRDSTAHLSKPRKTDSLQTVSDTTGSAFYLQIAAFAEIENAQSLKKDLLRLFPKVVVKEGSSHGKNIFRVRIGPFTKEKEAQAYGDSALAKNKISFRMVED